MKSPVALGFMIAAAPGAVVVLLVQGDEIAVYIARHGWQAMIDRAFWGNTVQGKQL